MKNLVFLLTIISFAIISCDKKEDKTEPTTPNPSNPKDTTKTTNCNPLVAPYLKVGNISFYDFNFKTMENTVSDTTIVNGYKLSITSSLDTGFVVLKESSKLLYRYGYPTPTYIDSLSAQQDTAHWFNCGLQLIDGAFPIFKAGMKKNDTLKAREADYIQYSYVVKSEDTLITVPAGNFHCYHISRMGSTGYDELFLDKEQKAGIVKEIIFSIYERNGTRTYLLRSKNF